MAQRRGKTGFLALVVFILICSAKYLISAENFAVASSAVASSAVASSSSALIFQEDTSCRQLRIDSLAMCYFNAIDFDSLGFQAGSSEQNALPGAETCMADFFSVLLKTTPQVARKAIDRMLDRASDAESGRLYGFILSLAEKYFYSVESPYYNENLLLCFLEHKIGRKDIAEIEKSRAKYLAAMLRRNPVGSMAEDFEFTGSNGVSSSLYDFLSQLTERQSLLLVFHSSGCHNCKNGIARLEHSPAVCRTIAEGHLYVLAVQTDAIGSIGASTELRSCGNGWTFVSDGGGILENSLYSMRNTPSLYLLDRSGEVQYKDISVSDFIDILLLR